MHAASGELCEHGSQLLLLFAAKATAGIGVNDAVAETGRRAGRSRPDPAAHAGGYGERALVPDLGAREGPSHDAQVVGVADARVRVAAERHIEMATAVHSVEPVVAGAVQEMVRAATSIGDSVAGASARTS